MPSRPGTDRERTVLGIAEDRHRLSRRRLPRAERRAARRLAHAKHRDVVLLVERDDRRAQPARRVTPLDDGVVLARDDVRRGDDELTARRPSRYRRSEAARGPEHAHDAGRRAANSRRAQQRRIGRRDARQGPAMLGNGSTRARIRSSFDGGTAVVEPLQDERFLRRAAKLLLTRDQQRRRADAPRRGRAPTAAPSNNPPIESSARSGGITSAPRTVLPASAPERLEQDGAERGARERGERRVRRVRTAGEELRREPRADDRADDDAREGKRAADRAPSCRPSSAVNATKASASQSTLVTGQAIGRLGAPRLQWPPRLGA